MKKAAQWFRDLIGVMRRHRFVAVGVVLAIGVASVLALQLRSGEETDTASASDATDAPVSEGNAANSSTEESDSAEETSAAKTDSDAAVRSFFETSDIALQSDEDTADLDAVAQGFVKGELEATRAEFAANGWRQKGSVTVVDIQTVERNQDSDPPTVTLQVCLDSSEVTIVNEAGDPVFPKDDGTPDRVPHLYTLVYTDSGWKVAEHSFPQARSC